LLRTPPARVSRRVGEAVTAAIQDRIFDNTTFANGLAKAMAAIARGGHVFAEAIERSRHQPPLRWLHDRAAQLKADGMAVLYTTTGKSRRMINRRLPGRQRAR
jgi:hypothetical protein